MGTRCGTRSCWHDIHVGPLISLPCDRCLAGGASMLDSPFVSAHDLSASLIPQRIGYDESSGKATASVGLKARHLLDFGANCEGSRKYCQRCVRPINACLCAYLPETPFNNCHFRVFIIQHPRCQVNIGTIRFGFSAHEIPAM